MAAGDAKLIPVKNQAWRTTFPIFDADGDLVSGAAGLDSEISKDGGAFADCTNEATEIGSTGIYTLDLTSTEMNADTVAIIVKTSTSGAKTSPIITPTVAAGSIWATATDVATITGNQATLAAGIAAVQADTDNLQTRIPAALVSGRIDASVGAMANDVLTAAAIAADAIGSSELAPSAVTEIVDAVWAKAMTDLAAVPGATAGTLAGLTFVFEFLRNRLTQTDGLSTLFRDDGTTPLGTSAITDDGTTATRAEWA